MAEVPILHFHNIRKVFGENVVLSGVDFKVNPGEIVALAGENGAGKSTLMNILFGMNVISATGGFEGTVEIAGKPVSIKTPEDALRYGIGMVHQEFMLLPDFSVARNIKLNRENLRPNKLLSALGEKYQVLDEQKIVKEAGETMKSLGLNMDLEAPVGNLPVGHMQFVEICREIDKDNLKLLVLDEPTAVLTENEAARLLECMRQIASRKIGIIFISHRLDEVMEVADRVVILRDGKMVFDQTTRSTNKKQIAEIMVGRNFEEREASAARERRELDENDIVLEFENFGVAMPGEHTERVNLKIKRGEIMGLGGLAGSGKASISNGIFGMYPAEGVVRYQGRELQYQKRGEALYQGMAFVSEDRKGVGLMLDESIAENISFTDMRIKGNYLKKFGVFSLFDSRSANEKAKELIEEFGIRCMGPKQNVGSLSGGNQQKVCLARVLITEPDILFVSEPTRGIDIGAKQLLLDMLVKLNREKKTTIVMTSSELNELRSVCDRIAIVGEGKIQGVLDADAPAVEFSMLMSGGKSDE